MCWLAVGGLWRSVLVLLLVLVLAFTVCGCVVGSRLLVDVVDYAVCSVLLYLALVLYG